jgi:hypothetical protein
MLAQVPERSWDSFLGTVSAPNEIDFAFLHYKHKRYFLIHIRVGDVKY